ncbi:MAG: FAD-dependent oxidoreductase [Dehalococcoidia bacterium]|nr:FAD-dependent oxidoreductase [Dehalococcoidia bacterium]
MKLLEPGTIGTMATRNRIVMCPMGTVGLSDLDGGTSRRVIDYYAARARGGIGLIITGATVVNASLEGGMAEKVSRLDSPKYISRLGELCDAVHHYGAKIAVQLSPGFGRVNAPPICGKIVSASRVPSFYDPRIEARELTLDEINLLLVSYATAAGMVKIAGGDAIEVHGYGGYLLDQFQTALWNKRTDKYGGNLDGRLRFSIELINAARSAVGSDFPILYKFNPVHGIPGGREIEEGLEICKRLEKAGVAALHIDFGCIEVQYKSLPTTYEPQACQIQCSEAVKKVVSIPVIAHGKLGDPQIAEAVLRQGKADFVALGRPLLADPEWVKKLRQGRTEDIRPCIGDMEGCINRAFSGLYLSCTVNAASGMEREYALQPAQQKKSVLVIGGGPGGLEAARVAALRGHDVQLWEKGAKLGGKLIPASVPSFKQDLRRLINYLSTQVTKVGVTIELMKEATPELVLQLNPDVAIVAIGATTWTPPIKGLDGNKKICCSIDLLTGKAKAGERVIVAGGGLVGCETAMYLAEQGKQVTIIEMMDRLVPEGIGNLSAKALFDRMGKSKIEVLTNTKLLEVAQSSASVIIDGKQRELEFDCMVHCLGFSPDSSLRDSLEGKVPELFAIGDCVKPRRIIHAMWEGFHTARLI